MQGIDFSIISVIVGIFVGLGTLIAGCGFAYAQFKTGGDKAKDDLIETLRATAVAEKTERERLAVEKTELITSHQAQINELKTEVGKLRGLYEASEKSKGEYLTILQGRDPQQQKFMENQQKFMEIVMEQIKENQKVAPQAAQYMAETGKILVEIRNFMERLNKGVKSNTEFVEEVKEATDNEQGKVLRKK